jgi:hypothetical protein
MKARRLFQATAYWSAQENDFRTFLLIDHASEPIFSSLPYESQVKTSMSDIRFITNHSGGTIFAHVRQL